jgi:predicted transcriptional regulator
MKSGTYNNILKFLTQEARPCSPHELSAVFGKSRVTIHNTLRRLIKNGWVTKEGTSPKTYYRAVDPFKSETVTSEKNSSGNAESVYTFISWCRTHGYHVPEIALEYVKILEKKEK